MPVKLAFFRTSAAPLVRLEKARPDGRNVAGVETPQKALVQSVAIYLPAPARLRGI
ncbi:MAG: hypothetical protein KME26_21965 [Oscillatoria princeps RMCB-10]|nr:hypothetical protein [Oscillatoria princeps RMCB-10]